MKAKTSFSLLLTILFTVILFAANASAIFACGCRNQNTGRSNSQNSLDWQGLYVGIEPCKKCEKTKVSIQINYDSTFSMQTLEVGKSSEIKEVSGKFSWDNGGQIIQLKLPKGTKKYFVGENTLTLLDKKNRRVKSKQSEYYVLHKKTNETHKTVNEITGKYWKLIELNGQKIGFNENFDKNLNDKNLNKEPNFNKEPHIILNAENNMITGHGGCNGFVGSYELQDGNRIKFYQVVSTMMACLDMEVEFQLLKILT